MRTFILALGFIVAALPARAQTIAPAEVKAHVGQTVTVQAAVSDVHTGRAGVIFIDIGGTYPNNDFAAVIFASDRTKFPNASDLKGKTVAITPADSITQIWPLFLKKTGLKESDFHTVTADAQTKLNAVINDIVREPATEARLRTFSMQTHVRPLSDTETYFRNEVAKWGEMVKAVGISAE